MELFVFISLFIFITEIGESPSNTGIMRQGGGRIKVKL